MGNSLSFFTGQKGYEEYEALVQKSNEKKRGRYHKHAKAYAYDPYQHISELYSNIANYLPVPFGVDEDIITEQDGLRSWYTVDFDETYKEAPLRLFQAEIIGSESFNVYERIKLHEKLLNLLRTHIGIKDARLRVEDDLQQIKENYKISEYLKWMRRLRKKSTIPHG